MFINGIMTFPSDDQIREEQFWNSMGDYQVYAKEACPKCGKVRVERWGCGKDICEKCHWCIQDNDYFVNEFFNA